MDAPSPRAGWFATRVRPLRNEKVLKWKEWEAARAALPLWISVYRPFTGMSRTKMEYTDHHAAWRASLAASRRTTGRKATHSL
ncbi:hypothetical protein SAMN06295920_104253 [Rhizorhabdus histidinilytica]|uniref:Uncharacterized protein n=1 Tax=Rhizorhabdus histidinilytica TaxID=439228 RepID=A0A1T5CS30_9SPHN|nr:hypothetical protein SAMN06295920_104253 [Rhizorhabdus histidinilytica]